MATSNPTPTEHRELLRLCTAGSVDDGKSTLIGRLLHDTDGVPDDQRGELGGPGSEPDWARLTDGLKAEREQGITIDVAYRHLGTSRRRFLIADAPGHEQYTRNMVTGASDADLALVLVDARHGLKPQGRRHLLLSALLQVPTILVAINKMDLVDHDPRVFARIRDEVAAFAARLGLEAPACVPLAARSGENVVHRSPRLAWHDGPTLLEHLESAPVGRRPTGAPWRFPVQGVQRDEAGGRQVMGSSRSGCVHVGDEVLALPSGRRSRVRAIETVNGATPQARPDEPLRLRLADELDLGRGELLVHPEEAPALTRDLEAHLVWFDQEPLKRGHPYLLKTPQLVERVESVELLDGVAVETASIVGIDGLAQNDIGRVRLRTHGPVFLDSYFENRRFGSFLLVDPVTHATAAAGLVSLSPEADAERSDDLQERFESFLHGLQADGLLASDAATTDWPERFLALGRELVTRRA